MGYLHNSQLQTHCCEYLAVPHGHSRLRFCVIVDSLDNAGSPNIKVAMLSERASKDLYVVHSCEQYSGYRLTRWSPIKPVTSSIAEPSPKPSLTRSSFPIMNDAKPSLHGVESTPPDALLHPPSVIHTDKSSNKVPVSNIVRILLARPFVILTRLLLRRHRYILPRTRGLNRPLLHLWLH